MKIVICWSSISGYWAACWRELQRIQSGELFVLAFAPRNDAIFDSNILEGLQCRLLDERERQDCALVRNLVCDQRPDVLIFVGWFVKAYRALATDPALAGVKKLMSVDTPWRNEFQYLTRLRYWRYFNALDGAGVTGERSWQYVKRLGFSPRRIKRNMYSVDDVSLTKVYNKRRARALSNNFLFAGRYTKDKAVDVLIDAYGLYRKRVEKPWTLTCCGSGSLDYLFVDVEGVVDRGFVQPRDMEALWLSASVFVLPSRFDPWPLVIVEAAMSGLPIIASDACGSAVEVLRHRFNGFFVPVDDVEALATAMVDCHQCDLAEMGTRARACAEGYSTEMWAIRWLDAIDMASS